MKKKVKIISKGKALKVLDKLTKLGKRARIFSYCKGKYNHKTVITGSNTEIYKEIYCVYRELRTDNYGKYAVIKSVSIY
jgi:hypothetical protein